MAARPGTTITLTITPDPGKRLKDGTLKYNDTVIGGTTFLMPEEDVLVTAEFEDAPVQLSSISITKEPDKTVYSLGEPLDLSGLEVTAAYSDGSSSVVTGYTASPVSGSTLDTEGSIPVTISYTETAVTRTATFNVQVNAAL
jgi:hypothetical protein